MSVDDDDQIIEVSAKKYYSSFWRGVLYGAGGMFVALLFAGALIK